MKYKRHGKSHDRIYLIWQNMIRRCEDRNCPEYKRYGFRGVKVCRRWHSFIAFYKDVGDPLTGKSFDRINNNLGYKPSNWRWATPKEQALNRRNTINVTHKGRTLSLSGWARRLKIPYPTINYRYHQGLPIDVVLSTSRFSRGWKTR